MPAPSGIDPLKGVGMNAQAQYGGNSNRDGNSRITHKVFGAIACGFDPANPVGHGS